MPKLAAFVFLVVLVACNAFIVETTALFPEQIASHYGGGGTPDGWMTRAGYLKFMLTFGALLPLVLAVVIGALPRLFSRGINIPNREYWLAPAERERTLSFLAAVACVFGSMIAVFIAGLHYVLLRANQSAPPRLPLELFWPLMGAFAVALVIWILALVMRFQRPG